MLFDIFVDKTFNEQIRLVNRFTKQQIKDITYDGKILESDGRVSGFVRNIDGKEKLKIWVPIYNTYDCYTDDDNYYDEWNAKRNNISVSELRSMRLEIKDRVSRYFPTKNNK